MTRASAGRATFARSRRIRSTAAHMAGLSLLAVSGAVAAGLVAEVVHGDPEWPALLASLVVIATVGLVLWRSTALPPDGGGRLGAVAAVAVSWITISIAGSLPYVLAGVLRWDLALFESVSGFTGTGATVLAPIEGNTHGVLFYRQMTQWVGGMGVVILAVAILPFLGIGGLQLFRAESTGPTSDQLVPRVSETAQRLWGVYCVLTAFSAVVLLAAGMGIYDALSHAVAAVGTGGFSPYNDGALHFDSVAVEGALVLSMFLGAVKFPLFYAAARRRDPGVFWRSSELRFFLGVVVGATALVTAVQARGPADGWTALRESVFNVMACISTTGFGGADFGGWAPAAQLVLLFLMVSGAMVGSTSGALKLFRVQVALKVAWREVRRVRRPRAVLPIRLGGAAVPERVVASVLGYVMFYFLVATASIVLLSMLGADLVTSAGSVVTAMGGVGPGLGETGPASNFLVLDGLQRAAVMLLMLLGRLEIYPLLLFLVPLAHSGRQRPRGGAVRPIRAPRDRERDRVG